MTIFYFLAGAIVGGVLASVSHGLFGAIAGGVCGALIVMMVSLRNRIECLQIDLQKLRLNSVPAEPREEKAFEPFLHTPEPEPIAMEIAPEPESRTVEHPYIVGARMEPEQFSFEPAPGEGSRPSGYNHPSPVAEAITRFFTGGNLMVKVGVIILFFGVSFLVKFAAERGMIPVELRLAAVTAGAIVLLAFGWRLRKEREQYALVLQGGGVGILYLTVFAAFRLYALLPASLTAVLLVAICVLSSALAIIQDSRTLAVLGLSGGFLAPILASTGSGSHVMLFSYYALLNAGIFGIAWFKAWRMLNLVGFAFTFVIGASWGGKFYKPEYFATVEPFLILFFVMYSLVAVLFAMRQKPDLKGYVDGTLVFGTPIVAAAIQVSLVARYEFGLAWSALGAGLYYIILAKWLFSRSRDELRLLSESFLGFGIVFATIAIPLALDGRWTAAAWALEGGAMIWAGIRQERWLVRIFGVALLVGGGAFFIIDLPSKGAIACLNAFWLGAALIAAAGLFASFLLSRNRHRLQEWEPVLAPVLLFWGLAWWYCGGLFEISRWLDDTQIMAGLVFVAVSATACDFAAERLKWDDLIMPSLLILPALLLALLLQFLGVDHPFADFGFAAWPVALLLYYLILSRREAVVGELLPYIHPVPVWIATVLLSWELHWWVGRTVGIAEIWSLLPVGLVPALFILLIKVLIDHVKWPFSAHRKTYLLIGALPLAAGGWGWNLLMNIRSAGDATPLPFLPILNPLDLAEAIINVIVVMWVLQLRREAPETVGEQIHLLLVIFYGSLFFWLNAEIVRVIHHFGKVAFSFEAMFASRLFQAAISLIWSITAFCAMTLATRKRMRTVWVVGAVILAAVVLKLFIIDLSGKGTVERIVSFVGVGGLMLVIGWFSPVPPRAGLEEQK
jgi:uncharacterized membrane protein